MIQQNIPLFFNSLYLPTTAINEITSPLFPPFFSRFSAANSSAFEKKMIIIIKTKRCREFVSVLKFCNSWQLHRRFAINSPSLCFSMFDVSRFQSTRFLFIILLLLSLSLFIYLWKILMWLGFSNICCTIFIEWWIRHELLIRNNS